MKRLVLLLAVLFTANLTYSQTPPDTISIALFVSQGFSIQEVAA